MQSLQDLVAIEDFDGPGERFAGDECLSFLSGVPWEWFPHARAVADQLAVELVLCPAVPIKGDAVRAEEGFEVIEGIVEVLIVAQEEWEAVCGREQVRLVGGGKVRATPVEAEGRVGDRLGERDSKPTVNGPADADGGGNTM
jgi:hypothetical protein